MARCSSSLRRYKRSATTRTPWANSASSLSSQCPLWKSTTSLARTSIRRCQETRTRPYRDPPGPSGITHGCCYASMLRVCSRCSPPRACTRPTRVDLTTSPSWSFSCATWDLTIRFLPLSEASRRGSLDTSTPRSASLGSTAKWTVRCPRACETTAGRVALRWWRAIRKWLNGFTKDRTVGTRQERRRRRRNCKKPRPLSSGTLAPSQPLKLHRRQSHAQLAASRQSCPVGKTCSSRSRSSSWTTKVQATIST
mmetsp:Transcript_9165/g.15738  ORF Transcript_9165/g.15738 Transcript_9165/m.15738 type:complete len:253 (-) Transcript_9165:1499-2257(-)